MKKRFMALFLALALCLGLATPAFAADTWEWSNFENEGTVPGWTLTRQGKEANFDFYVDSDKGGYNIVTENTAWTLTNTAPDSDDSTLLIEFEIKADDGHCRKEYRLYSDGTFDNRMGSDFVMLKSGESCSFSLKDVVSNENVIDNQKCALDSNHCYELTVARIRNFLSREPDETEYLGIVYYRFRLDSAAAEKIMGQNVPAFTDTPSWCAKEAQWAVDKGITNGAGSADRFAPTQDCAHEQILTFLWRAAGKPAAAQAPVTVASYYQDAVNWAYEKGFIDQSLQLSDPCTRAQAVWYIWKALGEPQAAQAASFSDVDAGAHYAGAVSWAVEKGVTKGYGGEDTFAPDRVCGRGEIACFLYRAYN